MKNRIPNETVEGALADLRDKYLKINPKSARASYEAAKYLPGGNTRSVLHYNPFPLTIVAGKDAEVTDQDGHTYLDCVGEFSAGLYGHSEPAVQRAIIDALHDGIVLGGPTVREAELAKVLTDRFPSMVLVRFCNSGTEANLLALVTAIASTKRKKIMVFDGAYHGGVFAFPNGSAATNVPFEVVLSEYNNIAAAVSTINENWGELAAVIVEPILGAGGNIPAKPEFLQELRTRTAEYGILLIFDEVKTSRLGRGGVQGLFGVRPDITTLGKYIGGGLPTGAFGGRRDLMEVYDPRRSDGLRHAGTFNNNPLTLAAGLAGLTEVFTEAIADEFLQRSEEFRLRLGADLKRAGVPIQVTGLGSLWTVHFTNGVINSPSNIPASSRQIGQLFHMAMLMKGILVASRGDIVLSLPMTLNQFARIHSAIVDFAFEYSSLINRAVYPR
ncbi:aspartate aminotransferase family protein [Bradyrhizobium canariense]|uniref:Glutamate-1-semialdehyde 2,1-aminomutase n=1 Tax=Bradyrhizobium canariense TaxID=255045 RepID=A0A1H1YQ56_9BRAD|nr:aminotransferase class III-fold pyridoxal phosphate-dependent enzyme [Bradyrhizobium canariense]SDT23594.1 glutamate-1-semialdehyde 2,1-aminomutase [Bradyrhizobium canariense]